MPYNVALHAQVPLSYNSYKVSSATFKTQFGGGVMRSCEFCREQQHHVCPAGGVSHGGLNHIFTEWSCKMAARWGTGEDMLTACKLEYFSPTTLDEVRLSLLFTSEFYNQL